MSSTMAEIEQRWKELAPHRPFLYTFLDDSFNQQYQADIRFGRLFSGFTGLAILIACLGLFGLTTYVTQQRVREIGIRKVLGASVANIVALVSKDFLGLVLLANILAWPLAWWAAGQWLQEFAYQVAVGWSVFALVGGAALLIAMLTISFQSVKAATANPVDALQQE